MNPPKDYRDFLRVMSSGLQPDDRMIVDPVSGDPGDQENMRASYSRRERLRPRTREEWAEYDLPGALNLYLCVMVVAPGVKRRSRDDFKGGIALLVDDVGDVSKERGIKVPKDIIGALRPTALVETSDGNFQAWYRFTTPIREAELFDRIIRAFIREKLMGKDPGQGGIARIARLPYGTNCKPNRNKWKVRLAELNEDVSYTPAEIIKAFNLTLDPVAPKQDVSKISLDHRSTEDFKYSFFKRFLESADKRNQELEDRRHEWKVVCPNWQNHTKQVRSGTTVFDPQHRINGKGYETKYHCEHGSCSVRTTGAAIIAIIKDNPEAYAEWFSYQSSIENELVKSWEKINDQNHWPFEDVLRAARAEEQALKERLEKFRASVREGVAA